MSNLNTKPHRWLKEQFAFESCAECSGDAQHHTAVPFMGNWFARCDFPPNDNGDPHKTVRQFRASA